MVAEWQKIEIETARERSQERSQERSRSRSREPHSMLDYQMALPPFFPKGFKDINGDDEERKAAEREKLFENEVHEMDVGDVERGRGT
jgi:hypothetical protein